MKKVILGLVALLLTAQSTAYAQQLVLPIGKNATNQQSPSNPQCVELDIGGTVYSVANPIPAQLSSGNAAVSSTNPLYVLPVNGSGAAAPTSLVQGNAVLSVSNPIFTSRAGVAAAANTTSVTTAVDGTADTLTFTAASRTVVFNNIDSADLLHIAITGTATTSSFPLKPGQTVTIELPFAASTVSVLSSGTSTDFGYLAY